MAGHERSMRCELGDFAEYADLREQLSTREAALAREGAGQRRAAASDSLARLRVGDVIRVPAGRRSGLAVVLDPGLHASDEPRPLVLTEDRWAGRLSLVDFTAPAESLGRVNVARNFDHRSPQARRDLASTLRNVRGQLRAPARRGRATPDDEVLGLRRAVRQHPCHGCADRDEHARWAERLRRLRKDTDALRRTHSIPRTFDRVCGLLEARGYLTPVAGAGGPASPPDPTAVAGAAPAPVDDRVTPAGRQLARIWSESDLLVAECLRHRIWDGLAAPELAAVVSAVLYETRRDDSLTPRVPEGPVREALAAMVRIWSDLQADEHEHRLELTREPDLGFAWPAYRWARGESLDRVLGAAQTAGQELSAGDFVRWCKQLVDLLDQIASVAGGDVAGTARAATVAVRRGVVAYSGTV